VVAKAALLVLVVAGGLPAWAGVIGAGIAAVVALVSIAVAATNARRDRRRHLYGEAYRTTMSWIEMAYRVHHAAPGDDEFLASYHKLWEDVRYYEGWLLFESSELGYSFARFKDAVQQVCDRFIEQAWLERSEETKPLIALPVEATPETFETELNAFLRDAREHLSPNPLRRAAMRRRIRNRITSEGGAHASGLPMTKPGGSELQGSMSASGRTRP
jgi:hypothetical protein